MSELLNIFAEKEIFTFNHALKYSTASITSLSRLLNKYINQNKILKIRDGLYYVVPLNKPSVTPNPYKISGSLTADYYLGYHTALELHGVAYTTFNTKYTVAVKLPKPFSYNGIIYQCVKALNNDTKTGIEKLTVDNLTINVSDRERTLIDCLDRLNYSGGIEEAVKSLRNFPSLNFNNLYKYLAKLNRKILFSKTGWLIQLLQDRWSVDTKFLNKLKGYISGRPMYLSNMEGIEYKHNSDWNLMIPSNINSALEGV